jgi:hypothetical protein
VDVIDTVEGDGHRAYLRVQTVWALVNSRMPKWESSRP